MGLLRRAIMDLHCFFCSVFPTLPAVFAGVPAGEVPGEITAICIRFFEDQIGGSKNERRIWLSIESWGMVAEEGEQAIMEQELVQLE